MVYPSLRRPAHLDDGHWSEIENLETRLKGAYEANDRALVIGTAKDLIEAVAKIVLENRGALGGGNVKFPKLIIQAHGALEAESGDGLTTDPHVLRISTAVMTIADELMKITKEVFKLRNKYGSGHGRVRYQELLDEHAEVALDGALLWARWALRRLDVLINKTTSALVADLDANYLFRFRKGDLADRLDDIDLRELDTSELRRLGAAVGRRAAYGTYTVREDGIERQEVADYPQEYHWGLLYGSFVDQNWNLCAHPDSIKDLFVLLIGAYGASCLADKVIETYESIQDIELAYRFEMEERQKVVDVLYELSSEYSNRLLTNALGKVASVVQVEGEKSLDFLRL